MKLKAGALSLSDEKKIVAEISNLSKSKRQLESLGNKPSTLEADKAKLDELRPLLDVLSEQIKAVDEELDIAKGGLNELDIQYSANRDSVNHLYTEKKRLAAELTAAKQEKSDLYTAFKESQDNFRTYETEQYQLREQARKDEHKANREAKLLSQAEFELEAADIPAFGEEIALCNAIYKFLTAFTGEKVEAAPVAAAAVTGRQVDAGDSMPKGATVVLRKSDNADEFMVLGSKKNKKQNKKPVESNKPLKIDIEMIGQFSRLGVSIPSSAAQVKGTLQQLDAKKLEYIKNQLTQTKANKEAAVKRVAALRAAAEEVDIAEE